MALSSGMLTQKRKVETFVFSTSKNMICLFHSDVQFILEFYNAVLQMLYSL